MVVYLSCDKGNGKSHLSTLPKILSWYDSSVGKVKSFLIDVDTTKKKSSDVAKSVTNSISKLTLMMPNTKIVIAGCTTDSGGGGTLHYFERELRREIATTPYVFMSEEYFVGSCALHNLQTCFRNIFETVIGLGGAIELGQKNGTYKKMCYSYYTALTISGGT